MSKRQGEEEMLSRIEAHPGITSSWNRNLALSHLGTITAAYPNIDSDKIARALLSQENGFGGLNDRSLNSLMSAKNRERFLALLGKSDTPPIDPSLQRLVDLYETAKVEILSNCYDSSYISDYAISLYVHDDLKLLQQACRDPIKKDVIISALGSVANAAKDKGDIETWIISQTRQNGI